MKSIVTIFAFTFAMQLHAQFISIPDNPDPVQKNSFSLQLNTSQGLGINYERMFLNRGKFSLWGQAGINSSLPSFSKRLNSSRGGWSFPAGYSANLGVFGRWNFNESHSLQLGGGIRRYQFYQPEKYKDLFRGYNFDPLSKYLELEYRFQPENSKLFFTAGYRHWFQKNSHGGGLKFGIGFNF